MEININLNLLLSIGLYLIVVSQALYIWTTRKEKNIVVKQKFTITSWGFTRYIIIDSNSQIYEIANSIWFIKQDAINDWVKLKINKKYKICCYGITSRSIGTKEQIIDILSNP